MTITTDDQTPVASLRLRQGPDGRLWAGDGDDARPVQPARCFPWSEPARFVSLRDEEGDEVALIVDPDELSPPSREALTQALADVGFLFEITRVVSLEEEVEIRTWTVQTRQGVRRFQTARDSWPRRLPAGDYLLRDVSGDLYRIVDPEALDPKSQHHLWAFIE